MSDTPDARRPRVCCGRTRATTSEETLMPTDPTRREFIKTTSASALAAAAIAAAPPAPATTQLAPPDKQRPGLNVPKPDKKPVGWAIVGLGQLALGEVMPAFRETKLARPVALVSG